MVENEQSFGEYLRQLIKDSGITQHKFYTELGIRKPYFYDILAGRTNPPPYPLQLKAMKPERGFLTWRQKAEMSCRQI